MEQTTNETEQREGTETRSERKKKRSNAYYSATPKFGKHGPSKLRQHFSRGITVFLIIAASILFYFALLRLPSLSGVVHKILNVLLPILFGVAIAYVLNPIVVIVDNRLAPFLKQRMKNDNRAKQLSRSAGIVLSLLLLILLIVALCNLLIPELYRSIRNLVFTLPSQMNRYMTKINEMISSDSTFGSVAQSVLNNGMDSFTSWLRNDLFSRTNELMQNLTAGVFNAVGVIFDFLIGMIVSVYLLYSKETYMRQAKKAVYAVFSPRNANILLHVATKVNEIFGGFVIGKIIDSAIIGVLCFVGMSIFKMPYVALVSVIVGVTNVIPFFGPYIGAIPSVVLIMLNEPIQGVYFAIFILALQQFDGNILGPKILGDTTGLSAFWVIFAILLGGGLFGFVGMLLGVPTFAVIYYLVHMILNSRLENKKLPVSSDAYSLISYVDEKGQFVSGEEIEEEERSDADQSTK